MDNCWYYYLLGEEFGPVTRQQLQELTEIGTLSVTDQVRHRDESVKQDVRSLLSTTSTVIASIEESAVAGVEEHAPPLSTEFSIDDFVIERTSCDSRVSPKPGLSAKATLLRPQESQFYLRSGDTTIGPLSLDALCRMADAGKIATADYIRRDEESDWHSANEVPEVMAAVIMLEATGRQKNRSRDSAVRHRRSVTGSGVSKRPTARNRRRNPKSRDEKLKGIFDEVFRREQESGRQSNPDPALEPDVSVEHDLVGGKVSDTVHQVPANSGTLTRSTAVVSTAESGTSMVNTVVPAGTSALQEEMSSVPLSSPTGLYGNTAPAAGHVPPAIKPWTPPAKKKKSKSGMDPDTLRKIGVGGGIVAAVALLPLIWSMLSGGEYAPDSKDVKPALAAYLEKYESASASPGSWQAFQTEVRPTVGGWVKRYRAATGARTADELKLQEAATKLVQLVNSKFDDREQHEKFLEVIRQQLNAG